MVDFKIPQTQINQGFLKHDLRLMRNTLFIVPKNDGEAKRALEILEALEAPHVLVSEQGWGATLDKEVLSDDALRGAVFVDPTSDKPYLFHLAMVRVNRQADPELPDLATEEVLDCQLVGVKQHEGTGSSGTQRSFTMSTT